MKENNDARSARSKRKLILLQKRSINIRHSKRDDKKSSTRAVTIGDVSSTAPYTSTSSGVELSSAKEKRLRRQLIISRKRKRTDSRRHKAKPWNFGPPKMICKYCGAIMWYEERSRKTWNPRSPNFSLCCSEGKVQLPLLKPPPPALKDLLDHNGGNLATSYQNNIRMFNAMFSFTSMGGNIDYSMNDGRGPRNFRLNGHNYHRIGSLLPPDGQKPRFAQLYIYDTQNEVNNRVGALNCEETSLDINSSIVHVLVKMLDESNVLVKTFRMARDRFEESHVQPLRLRLISDRSTDGRQYNLPTASEVAAIIVGDFNVESAERDIIIDERSIGLKRISVLHPSFMAMQYPLLFPYGEDGYRLGIKHTNVSGKLGAKETYVTMREYYAFRLQKRFHEGDTLLRGGRLFQQYVVDAYTCIEEARLMWIRNNQKKLRAELYKGLKDAVFRGDTDAASIGKLIMLPSTFTGSPRFMVENYQDAMAICRWAGYPDLFITYTCNPKWPEIESLVSLIPGEKIEDHPDAIVRVYKIKLDEFLDQLIHRKYFGRVIAVVYTIEFQKRGLPHSHILLFLHPDDKHPDATTIDKIISAEIPDREDDPEAYEAVKQFMMHGPCGEANMKSPCMLDQKCSKHFPKMFNTQTTIDEDGFAIYRRNDDGRFVIKNGIKLDNRFVVPYNRDLLVKFQAHINVEWCNRSRSIKYLFKYVTKGPDRGTFVLHDSVSDNSVSGMKEVPTIDEVKMYLQCRYISACEACWRIFKFEIHYRDPPVQRLAFHLEDEQNVTFEEDECLDDVAERPDIERTMFTEWLKTNKMDESARELTYVDFPTKWVWHRKTKEWKPRKSGRAIGRIYNAHPASGEKFYLRILLNVIKGPTCFKDMRTMNNIEYPTYRAACFALGLLDSDEEWDKALNEASIWASGKQLRKLFATILLYCDVADPCALWQRNWKILSEDILHRQRRILKHPTLQLSDQQLQNYTLVEIEDILTQNGRSLKEFETIPFPDMILLRESNNRLIEEELNHDKGSLAMEHTKLLEGLNIDQRQVYDKVVDSANTNKGGLFFVYGHGGTGKTYLWRTLIAYFRSLGKIVLAVASSGIAALLMSGGRTAHSRFSIPINISNESTCHIKKGTQLAELLLKTSVIIWDEAPMAHRYCLEALDRSLRDILQISDSDNSRKPFGGKTVVLGGDFRQILPVIPKGRREHIVDATINQSYLWSHCKIFKLHKNMRLAHQSGDNASKEFAEWILKIGEGKFADDDGHSWINIPSDLRIQVSNNPLEDIVSDTYPDLQNKFLDTKYLEERAILAPTNDIVQTINEYAIGLIDSEERTYLSSDSICKGSSNTEGQDLLYPVEFLNSLNFPAFPKHELRLKVGLPVMLLRNLNQTAGLCNGTRMVITQLATWVVEAQIITGTHVGKKVFIPRIVLSPSESKWPFVLKRRQFPLAVCFAMTINKSQGQSLRRVGLFLPKPVFCHGQLYVAASRVTSRDGLRILITDNDHENPGCTKNIVYKEVFRNLP